MAPRKKVDKPFASGTMTKAAFFSFLRSGLRQKSRRWKPIYDCLALSRRPSKSKNKRLKWEAICRICDKWFPLSQITVDHIVPAGSLKELEDLPGFVKRLFCEKEGLQTVCTNCHDKKTADERGIQKLGRVARLSDRKSGNSDKQSKDRQKECPKKGENPKTKKSPGWLPES